MLQRKWIVVVFLLMAVTLGVAAMRPPKNGYTNLEVLPRDIPTRDLTRIMVDEFDDGLGVSCTFCHAPESPGSQKLDYASDAKPEKAIARSMMRMTLKVNKRWFSVKKPMLGTPSLAVTCVTCHNGKPHPDGASGQ
ncbi:MAG TPA: c-type cytochrome [Puia sp.]|jgi:hypothetical protein